MERTTKILDVFKGFGVHDIRENELLEKHTTWRIGGPADYFVAPHSVAELQGVIRAARATNLPWIIIGRGSNMLVRDGGVRGIVIKIHDNFAQIDIEGNRLVAQAGRSFVSAANVAILHNLGGLEFATGIPGSVGGAVMMNAGAHGGQVADVFEWVDAMDGETGEVERLYAPDMNFGYRHSVFKERPWIAVEAAFQLYPADGEILLAKVKQWAQRRSSTQPLSLPSCGSVFRNPEGTHAAYLLEQAGLKGLRKGDAQISDKHANFIVNLGGAKASDVLWLVEHAQTVVLQKFGIKLETEVRIVGESS